MSYDATLKGESGHKFREVEILYIELAEPPNPFFFFILEYQSSTSSGDRKIERNLSPYRWLWACGIYYPKF